MKLRKQPNSRRKTWICPATRMLPHSNPLTRQSMSLHWIQKTQTTLWGLIWTRKSRRKCPHIIKPCQQLQTNSQATVASLRVSQLSVSTRLKVNNHSHRMLKKCTATSDSRAFKGDVIETVLSCAIIRLTYWPNVTWSTSSVLPRNLWSTSAILKTSQVTFSVTNDRIITIVAKMIFKNNQILLFDSLKF